MATGSHIGTDAPSVLVVGDLGYHEENIALPIIDELTEMGARVFRLGGSLEFFRPASYANQVFSWVSGISADFSAYDIIFFLDWWNPALPLFCYRIFTDKVPKLPMVGLCHGSVTIEGDVASTIPFSKSYEQYLFDVFDRIFVPVPWLFGANRKNVRFTPFPIEGQMKKERPDIPVSKRVTFAQRWDHDKAPDGFEVFAHLAVRFGIKCIATAPDTGNADIEFVGWQTQEGLRELAKEGGYIWGAARQDMFSYSILNMVSYGLTPLLHLGPSYSVFGFDKRFFFQDGADACALVGKTEFTRNDWRRFIFQHEGNARWLAKEVLKCSK